MTNCVQVCRAFTCGRCVKYHDDSLPAGHPRKCSESHAVPKKEIKCCSTLLPGQETNTTRRNSPSAAFFSDDNRRALSFEDAFDGEANVHSRRLKKCGGKDNTKTHSHRRFQYAGGTTFLSLFTFHEVLAWTHHCRP